MTENYIAYSTASATWIARGTSVEEARSNARRVTSRHGGRGADDMIVVFDGGSDADHITSEMQAHRLLHNLESRPIVWRGALARRPD